MTARPVPADRDPIAPAPSDGDHRGRRPPAHRAARPDHRRGGPRQRRAGLAADVGDRAVARPVLRHRCVLRLPGHGQRAARRPGLPAPRPGRRRGRRPARRAARAAGAVESRRGGARRRRRPGGARGGRLGARAAARVVLLDSADELGGQYWRHLPASRPAGREGALHHGWARFTDMRRRLTDDPGCRVLTGAQVWA